jgi:hypothetical protein
MLRLAVILLAFTVVAGSAEARTVGETQIVSETALTKLKRNKGVTLQWLWGARPGALDVNETRTGVRLKGGQGPHKGDELTIDGIVTRIEDKNFWFKGRIVIVDNETTEPCVREGTYMFRITSGRKYWRMKEQEARCPGRADLTDYVDIRF